MVDDGEDEESWSRRMAESESFSDSLIHVKAELEDDEFCWRRPPLGEGSSQWVRRIKTRWLSEVTIDEGC